MAADWLTWKQQNIKEPQDYNIMLNTLSTPLKDKFSYNVGEDDRVQLLLTKESIDDAWKALLSKYEKQGYLQMVDEVNQAAKDAGMID